MPRAHTGHRRVGTPTSWCGETLGCLGNQAEYSGLEKTSFRLNAVSILLSSLTMLLQKV